MSDTEWMCRILVSSGRVRQRCSSLALLEQVGGPDGALGFAVFAEGFDVGAEEHGVALVGAVFGPAGQRAGARVAAAREVRRTGSL